jgi:hypothetical protein
MTFRIGTAQPEIIFLSRYSKSESDYFSLNRKTRDLWNISSAIYGSWFRKNPVKASTGEVMLL